MFWGPQAWGMYHSVLQDHGRGDGSDGKLNNLLCRALPTAAHYKGSNVNQDMKTVSVRGQAFVDWLAPVLPPPPPPRSPGTAHRQWLGSWFGPWLGTSSSVGSGNRYSMSAAGGLARGGTSAVSFHDVDAPRKRVMFVPWSRRSYRTR
jgi:hypothetical protein